MAVLLVSTELDEILSLSDRIAVMYAGQIIDTLSIEEANREKIGLLMAGVTDSEGTSVTAEPVSEGVSDG
jgi:simple sugar transport system ATP-binding protein